MTWVRAVEETKLNEQGRALFRHENKQIAVFYLEGKAYAVNNRCPHEGYPLKEGSVDVERCVLTCRWHNWKFDLKNGVTLRGEDHVRTYPTKTEDGYIWLDLNELPEGLVRERAMENLKSAVTERQYGRIAREISRLILAGIDPLEAVTAMIAESHDKLEFGFGHAFAAGADWLQIFNEHETNRELQVLALTEFIDHLANDTIQQKLFPYPEEAITFDGTGFLTAMEVEDEERAVAMVRGALRDGLGWPELEPWFSRAALQHYNGFGHALIYVFKTGQLLAALGPEAMPYLLLPLTRYVCHATREDLLPEFRLYQSYRDVLSDFGSKTEVPDDGPLFGRTLKDLFSWLTAKAPKQTPESLHQALLTVCARNLLYFDTRFQSAFSGPIPENVGWLDFSHGITFANAVREQCTKFPELWPAGLLQMACFAGRNKAFIHDDNVDFSRYNVTDRTAFFDEVEAIVLDHGYIEPIYSCHLLKTVTAVRAELPTVGSRGEHYLLASLNRFLHARIKEKHVRRTIRQALSLTSKE